MPRTKSKDRRRPTVSIVGVGRLGTALALALADVGYEISAVVSRRLQRAKRVALQIRHTPFAFDFNSIKNLPPSDLVLIATPDDAIESVAAELANGISSAREGTVLHTSGALSSVVLSPLKRFGFHTGSIHPLVSVSDPVSGAASLRDAFYCIEGDRTAVRLARKMVRDLGGRSFSVATDKKVLYHAAAVMASPQMVALFDIALEMLVRCGLKQLDAQRVLVPLLNSTVKNLERSSPEKALTGTFARGDVATVRKHLNALTDEQLKAALFVYRLLGFRSIEIATKAGLDLALARKVALALEANEEEPADS